MEVLKFPDGKAMLIAWLTELTGLAIASRVPDERPEKFLKVQDAGANRVNRHLREMAFTLEFWAQSTPDAYDLGATVLAHFEAAEALGGVTIYAPRDWGPPVELPDESGQPRYTATVQFRVIANPA